MKIYWSILTSRGYPTKEDKLREEEEYLRQLEKIRLMLGAEKESDKREEEFEVLVDSVKRLHETVSIKRADCEKQIENAKAKIEAAREEYEQKYLPRMWSEDGILTINPNEGYFVEVKDNMTTFWLQKLYPNENWKDLGAMGIGIYRWDVVFEQYEKVNFYDYEMIKTFVENNRDNISEWL